LPAARGDEQRATNNVLLVMLLPLALFACAVPAVERTSTLERPDTSEVTGSLQPLAGQRIVCYNVENLFDTTDDTDSEDSDFLPAGRLQWTEERYKQKLAHLAEAIGWSGNGAPPIIGLVEVENRRVVEALAATPPLKEHAYTVVHHDSPDERGIDVALLVRDTHAEVLAHEALTVRLEGDRTRDVLYAELALAKDERLHVFVDHWPSRREGLEKSAPKRMAAARVVRAKVDAILARDPRAQVLIMGDFNDAPTDASIQEGLRAACDRSTTADLFDLMCIDQPSGHGSHNYQGEWAYLDQFIVSRSLLAQVKEAKAFWDDRLLFKHPRYGRLPDKTYAGDDYKGGYSDHLPVVLSLK
jgi:endonuclease/exonuclease/phosphatase family metal-dependent hydrolase